MSTSGSTELLARMQELRNKAAQDDPSPRSSCTEPSTLATFLLIYSKASRDCYIEYHQGAKDLHSWLTCNGTVPLNWEVHKYPEIENAAFHVPVLSGGYEFSELAKLLSSYKENNDLAKLARAERAIYFTMTKQVVYELY